MAAENILTDAELAKWYRAEADGARAEMQRRLNSAHQAAEGNAQVEEQNVTTALHYADKLRAKAEANRREAETYAREAAINEQTVGDLRAEVKASRQEAEAYARKAAANAQVADELRAEMDERPRRAARIKKEIAATRWQPLKDRYRELRGEGCQPQQARDVIEAEMRGKGQKSPSYRSLERHLKG